MSQRVPVCVTISRASVEAAWQKHRRDGGEMTADELEMEWIYSDNLAPAQEQMFADFILHTLLKTRTEDDDDEALDGTCGSD